MSKVSFATTAPSDPYPACQVVSLDESTPSLTAARAVFERLAHLVITPDRLTLLYRGPISIGGRCDVYFAKLDETSQTPKDVAVERLKGPEGLDPLRMNIRLARQLKAWEGLRHPNVLELLGYYISSSYDVAQLISPYSIHGGLREYLARTRLETAQRLEFVRDITAGLEYLHSRDPPISHGDLNPFNITVDEKLSAVLSCFGLASVCSDSDDPSGLTTASPDPMGTTRYMSPELLIAEDRPRPALASDIWAWGCTAFEILTDKKPFHSRNTPASIFASILGRNSPGRPELLLDVPGASKPEYASTLRLLHSYIPLCWEYEPRKRPSISLVRQKAFMFLFESDAGDSVMATLEELAHLLIPPERLSLFKGPKLGSGNYGEVVLGTLDKSSPTPKDVAVKRLKAVGTRGERVRLAKRLARELNVWAKIKHPNVVELIGYYLDEQYESPLLISTLMPHGDVLTYIENFKPDIQQRITFTKGITVGLACLHNFNPSICHADLKPANVLIDLHMNAVLCDFGLASFVGDSPTSPGLVTTTLVKGTPRYMSPELHFDDDITHSLESDVWAWACTVFHVLTGKMPYAEALGERKLCLAIAQEQPPGDIALLLPNNLGDADSESTLALRFLHSVIPRCWDFEPQRRPPMATLLSKISDLSSEMLDGLSGSEDGCLRGSDEGVAHVEVSEILSGGRAGYDEVAREGEQVSLENDHLPGEKVSEESIRVDRKSTEAKGGSNNGETGNNVDTQVDTRNTLINVHPQIEKVVEEKVVVGQDEAATREDINNDEPKQEKQIVAGDKATDIASNRWSSKISTPALGNMTLGATCIFALLSTIGYQSFRTSDSPPILDPLTVRSHHSPNNISTQQLSTFIAVVCFLSLCANIYFVLRKVDSPPPRDQAEPATSKPRQG